MRQNWDCKLFWHHVPAIPEFKIMQLSQFLTCAILNKILWLKNSLKTQFKDEKLHDVMLMNFTLIFFTQKRKLKFEEIFLFVLHRHYGFSSHPFGGWKNTAKKKKKLKKFISTILTHLMMHCWNKLWIANSLLWIMLDLKTIEQKTASFLIFFCVTKNFVNVSECAFDEDFLFPFFVDLQDFLSSFIFVGGDFL